MLAYFTKKKNKIQCLSLIKLYLHHLRALECPLSEDHLGILAEVINPTHTLQKKLLTVSQFSSSTTATFLIGNLFVVCGTILDSTFFLSGHSL
jgi:hypothetical protein